MQYQDGADKKNRKSSKKFNRIDHHDGRLVVQGAATIDDTIDDAALERLRRPVAVDRHYVQMSGQHVGKFAILIAVSLHFVEEAVVVDDRQLDRR